MSEQAGGRVFIAEFCMESNTFSDLLTGRQDFGPDTYLRTAASLTDPGGLGANLRVLRDLAEADGFEVAESLCAYPEPGGPIVRTIYEEYRGTLLADLHAAGEVAMILLVLHGAMVAEGYDDCEGDILRRARAIVGPRVTIGVELDPHCHLSGEMVENADLLVVMKEYPHTDWAERAVELYRLCKARSEERIQPVSAVFDCRMVGLYPTTLEPMASFVRTMEAAETEAGILSVSLAHGFPWGDTADTGTRVLVIADSDSRLASSVAERLGRLLYSMRDTLLPPMASVEAALEQARQVNGLVVLADAADNTGGGAPGDRTDLLAATIASGLPSAFATIYDPQAVDRCMAVGEGARVSLSIGGKLGVSSGPSLELEAEVVGLSPRHEQTVFGNLASFGRSAWIRAGSTDIVLASARLQVFSPDTFTNFGIDLSTKRIVAVKSMEHFRAGFRPIADHIIRVASPGALSLDFAKLNYVRKRDLSYHPRVIDPIGVS